MTSEIAALEAALEQDRDYWRAYASAAERQAADLAARLGACEATVAHLTARLGEAQRMRDLAHREIAAQSDDDRAVVVADFLARYASGDLALDNTNVIARLDQAIAWAANARADEQDSQYEA